MSTWEERMASRAAFRSARTEAERLQREELEQTRLRAEFPPVEGEYDWAETEGEHRGHRAHTHHGIVMCQCGEVLGIGSIVIDPEDWPLGECTVCAARGILPGHA